MVASARVCIVEVAEDDEGRLVQLLVGVIGSRVVPVKRNTASVRTGCKRAYTLCCLS